MNAVDLPEPRRPVLTKRMRMVAALIYATAVTGLLLWGLPRTGATMPMILILLGLPLIFRMVPRNYLYGMRSARTLWTTEETWYRQNTITGVVMVGIGVLWLARLAIS
jgi:hypothetical protein